VRRALLLALLAALCCAACDPIDSEPEPSGKVDPAEAACDARGGDYLCKGTRPDGSLNCTCTVP